MIRVMSGQLRAVAVVVAVAAIVFVGYRHEHRAGGPVMAVLAANRPIQEGTSGDVIRSATGFYTVVSVRTSQIDAGAIVDASVLSGKLAVKDIPAGQQLTTADFAPATSHPSFPGGAGRAVVIKPSKEISGQVSAGTYVDVSVATATHGSNALRRLYRNLEVLAVSTSDGTVTLRATARQAGMLIYASANDRLVVRLHR